MTTNRVGSMFTWFFTGEPVTDFASAATSDTAAFGRFHRAMMEAGVWLPPSQFEAAFVSTAHGAAEVEMVVEAARKALLVRLRSESGRASHDAHSAKSRCGAPRLC